MMMNLLKIDRTATACVRDDMIVVVGLVSNVLGVRLWAF